MSKHTVISLDLAKRVIQVAKISRAGELLFNKTMSPDKLREFLAKQKSSLVVMEGCGSCHYWARFSNTCGHKAKIIAPKAVKPYVSGQKTDANDAIGIAVASQQLGMSFCPIKSVEQQTLLSVDTSRKFLDKSKKGFSTLTVDHWQYKIDGTHALHFLKLKKFGFTLINSTVMFTKV